MQTETLDRDVEITAPAMEERIVRYGELVPCKTAFIDAHTPGSDQKENFTIIGGGVSEAAHLPGGIILIGRALVEHILEVAHEHRLQNVWLDASLNAIPFYERLGFVVTGEDGSRTRCGVTIRCTRMARLIR